MKVFNLYNDKFIINDDFEKYNEFRNLFTNIAKETTSDFLDMYKQEIFSMDMLINKIPPYARKLITNTISSEVIRILVQEGVMAVNTELFLSKYYYKYFDFDKYFDPILEKYVQITEAKDSLNSYREMQKASRSRWQGGGFGVEGAIKGAMTAGALNLGTDLLRSFGDSNTSRQDRNKINSMKDQIYNNPSTISTLKLGIYNCIFGQFFALIDELVENNIIQPISLKEKEAKIILENTLKYDRNSPEKIFKNIINCLKMNPYNFDLYKLILEVDNNNEEIILMAIYFGFEENLEGNKHLDNIKIKEINNIVSNKNISFSTIDIQNYQKCKTLLEEIKSTYHKIPNCEAINKIEHIIKEYEILQLNKEVDFLVQNAEIDFDNLNIDNMVKCITIVKKIKDKSQLTPSCQNYKKILDFIDRREHPDKYKNDNSKIGNDNSKVENETNTYYISDIKEENEYLDYEGGEGMSTERVRIRQFFLAQKYQYGDKDFSKDLKRAFFWFQKSAELGYIGSQACLGDFYLEGLGIKKDYEKAYFWYSKGAENGYSRAQTCLAKCYYNGIGVQQNHDLAYYWFSKAANDNETEFEAMYYLGLFYEEGKVVKKDLHVAKKYFTKATKYYDPEISALAKQKLESYKNKCFITTATCTSLGKLDNCYELNLFRKFRDEWLLNEINGEAIIQEYYNLAPQIVNKINSKANSTEIYNYIWENYLCNCLKYIKNNENQQCKFLYIKMVRDLEKI